MTAIKRAAFVALAFGISLSAATANARAAGTGTFRVSLDVPMACWVSEVSVDVVAQGAGEITEGCNSASGYVVSASHRPLEIAERARLVYGDRTFALSAAGHQVIRREFGPRVQQVAYRLAELRLNSPLTLSFTIQPL